MRYSLLLAILSFCLQGLSFPLKSGKCLENTLALRRPDEPVIYTRTQLESLMGKAKTQSYTVQVMVKGKPIPSQCDDLNGDGIWDELAFVYSFEAGEKICPHFTYILSSPSFPSRTHARLAVSLERNGQYTQIAKEERPADLVPQARPMLYQYEGVGWENDKVAFRSYFDSRNGKDIFGKRLPALILDSLGLPGKDYHLLSDWGMDILKVGNSLGAGALAVFYQGKLYRLGPTEKAFYQRIADGPVRCIVKLRYEGWTIGDTLQTHIEWVEEEITLWAGSYAYESKITWQAPKVSGLEWVTGIVTLKNKSHTVTETSLRNHHLLFSHEIQSENQDELGMAILCPQTQYISWTQSPENGEGITHTAYLRMKAGTTNDVKFSFYALWGLSDPQFKKAESCMKLLKQWEERKTIPLKR